MSDAPTPKPAPIPEGVSIANHPRARVAIRRSRARIALVAFGLVLLVALRGGLPAQTAVERALLAGLGGYLATWAAGVAIWKQIVLAELRRAYEKREQRRRELLEALAARS